MRSRARPGAVTPEIRYANNGDVNLAYQVVGDGPIDLVYVAGALTNLALAWEQPGHRRFCERLAATGEVEPAGGAVRGIAVHTGARVAAQAAPGEVLVSQTVKDLVAGSGIEFTDRGSHELKGIPGEWRLFAAA